MKLKWSVITWLCCLIIIPGWSQESTPKLSVDDCINIALQNNTTIQTYRNLARSAELNVKASYSNILPTVNTSFTALNFQAGEATSLQDVPVGFDSTTGQTIFEQRETTTPGRERNNHSADISIDQTIFDGGNWWNSIRQSKANEKVAEYDLEGRVNETIRLVAQNYFTLLQQEKLLEVYSLAVQRSQENLERSEKMFEIGSVAKIDVFRAKVNLGNDRIALINQRNTVHQSRQLLNISMGRSPNEPLEIVKEYQFAYQLPPLEDLIKTAYDNQPEIRRLEMDLRSRELGVGIAKSRFLPSVSGFFRYTRENQTLERVYTELNQNWTTVIGLQVNYNLFNGFTDQVNFQNAKINVKNTRLALEDYKRNLRADISTIYQNFKDLQEIVEINKGNLAAAQEEYRLATERYRLGSGTSLDVREAQVNLTDAERILVTTEYNLIITYAELQEAVGKIQTDLEF